MAKSFNITGLCSPKKHYMADVSAQLGTTLSMIENGDYFIINRPRQYGKTTTLYSIAATLRAKGDYLVFNISFEGIGDVIFDTEASFSKGFLEILSRYAKYQLVELEPWLRKASTEVENLHDLSDAISDLMLQTDKKVVLLIDEVDKSSNNDLFVLFLGLLRNKFLQQEELPTFHSVVLAGLHDVKTLKLKLRPNEEKTYNSPWNIATAYKVNMNLLPHEIKPMLEDYAQEQGVKMDTQLIADRLFYLTSGYPYLVSHLCKIIVEDIMPTKTEKEWTEADVNRAFQLILKEENNANFDSLTKTLKNNADLYQLVFSVIIDGVKLDYRTDSTLIDLGKMHGIFDASENDSLIIHNRIYRERIANYMISEWRINNLIKEKEELGSEVFDNVSQYHLPNKGLDMQKVLENFQAFMKKEYSSKDRKFLERDGRMVFLAFMRPILNGAGYDFKEPQVSDEKRLDVIITYYQHLYVAELKIWHGEEAHKKGLAQLVNYLDTLGLDTGFLLIFDHNKKKMWEKDWVTVDGKRIFYIKL
jgi:AAA-like domain